MNWLDLIIVVSIGIGVIKGLFDGFVKQAVSLLALVAGVLFAGLLATMFQPFLHSWGLVPGHLEYPICYVASFVLIFFVMGLVARFLEGALNWVSLGCFNNLAGGVAGLLITVIGFSLFFNFLLIFDRNSHLISEQTKQESVLFNSIQAVVPTLYPYARHKIEEGWKEYASPEGENKEEQEPVSPRQKERPEKTPDRNNKDVIEV